MEPGATGRLYRRGVLRHKAPFRYQALFTYFKLMENEAENGVFQTYLSQATKLCCTTDMLVVHGTLPGSWAYMSGIPHE